MDSNTNVAANNSVTNTTTTNLSLNMMQDEIQHMLHYTYDQGLKIPTTISKASIENNYSSDMPVQALISDYNALIDVIAPTTPESIRYVYDKFDVHQTSGFQVLKLSIFKKYIFLTFVALVILILVSLSPDVNATNEEQGLLASSGKILALNLTFICCAAFLGVMFYILKTLKDKVNNFTLKAIDVMEVNITIMIGIVSGFIISEIFTFTGAILGNSLELHKMTLAMLGGFSSDAIFSVLQGAVNKLKLLFTAQ